MVKRFASIGEVMIELSGGQDDCYRLGFAGDTLNTAWYARALLPEDWSVDYVSALGDDRYSARLRIFLEENGIGTDYIQSIAGKNAGLYIIHQEEGDRHFTYWRDGSAARLMVGDTAVFRAGLRGADLIYFSGITMAILAPKAREAVLDAIADERAGGARVAFDPNIRPRLWESDLVMRETLAQSAATSDIVLPTYGDDKAAFGDSTPEATADRYLALGVSEVVVKNGGDPAVVASATERHWIGPEALEAIIDATGAGDSFNAGYLSCRISGLDLEASVHSAHRLARQVTGYHGALIPHAELTGC